MHVLEENYLRTIIILNEYIAKINEKYLKSKLSESDFRKKHLAYSDLNSIMYHSAIIQARKLFEADFKYDISNDDWQSVTNLRNEIAHSKKPESRVIKEIAETAEVHRLLDIITAKIYEKYSLDQDEKYQHEINKYINDIKDF